MISGILVYVTSKVKPAFIILIPSLLCVVAIAANGAPPLRWQQLTSRQPAQQQTQPPTTGQQIPVLPVTPPVQQPARTTLSVVVLDPAHGGADAGARGSSGINESDVVLDFARSIRAALESQGLRVVQTRTGNDNPSFDDRSATANAQRGAVFISLHVSSTGTPGQVRVYSELMTGGAGGAAPAAISFPARNGLLPWDRAQESYVGASRRLAELTQVSVAQKISGSPSAPLSAQIRQLRTVAAPAIAIEVSSVSVSNRDQLMKLAPGLADAVAQAVVSFRPIYEATAH